MEGLCRHKDGRHKKSLNVSRCKILEFGNSKEDSVKDKF
jgi:hypothetical protein